MADSNWIKKSLTKEKLNKIDVTANSMSALNIYPVEEQMRQLARQIHHTIKELHRLTGGSNIEMNDKNKELSTVKRELNELKKVAQSIKKMETIQKERDFLIKKIDGLQERIDELDKLNTEEKHMKKKELVPLAKSESGNNLPRQGACLIHPNCAALVGKHRPNKKCILKKTLKNTDSECSEFDVTCTKTLKTPGDIFRADEFPSVAEIPTDKKPKKNDTGPAKDLPSGLVFKDKESSSDPDAKPSPESETLSKSESKQKPDTSVVKNIPVEDLRREIHKIIGKRSRRDVFISIMMGPNCSYTLHVTEKNNGEILGNVPISDATLQMAYTNGLFDKYLSLLVLTQSKDETKCTTPLVLFR